MNPDQVLLIVLASIGAWTVARVFRGPLGEAIACRFTERVLLQERQAGQLRPGEVP